MTDIVNFIKEMVDATVSLDGLGVLGISIGVAVVALVALAIKRMIL